MKRLDAIDLPDEARELVRECEVTGRQTAFTRGGRNVAVLVTWDEYLALRETVDIARDEALRTRIGEASAAIRRNDMLLAEDIIDNKLY
ncbi:MAG: hypothetical protein WA208_05575 [Thermoanaerobaculia bacterium]